MFRKTPMSGSSSGRVRFATGVPMAKSVCPEWRWRRACQTARTVMKTVAWPRRARRRRASASAGGRSSRRESPRKLATGGRGGGAAAEARDGGRGGVGGEVGGRRAGEPLLPVGELGRERLLRPGALPGREV